MFVIEVIPLGRNTLVETLSYFSHTAHPVGALLSITVRNSTTLGVVVKTTDAFSMKTALRAATFSLRKLGEQEPRAMLSPHLLHTGSFLSEYYGTTMGSALMSIIPKEIREGDVPFTSRPVNEISPASLRNLPYVFMAPGDERLKDYKRLVRESFANKKSVLCICPTLEYLKNTREYLSAGIGAYTITLGGGEPKSVVVRHFEMLASEPHPLLILTTPSYGCIDRPDIGTTIIDHARSIAYRAKQRPYIDYRVALETHSQVWGRTIIIGDTVVRTEDAARVFDHTALPFGEEIKRIELPSQLKILPIKEDADPTHFTLLTPELTQALLDTVRYKRRFFLFSARRGLAPLVTCVDCKHIFRDPESGAPLALVRTIKNGAERRTLVSSVSGYHVRAPDACPSCGSWRLKERGIGIQHVYDEVVKNIPREQVMLFDHTTANTHKKAEKLGRAFYEKKGVILIGTALALPYITKPIHASGVVSMDSLRALPSWRQHEEAFAILMTLREKSENTVFVQTRTEDELLEYAKNGSLASLYMQELAVRAQFHYPPVYTFIHFSWQEKQGGKEIYTLLKTLFASHDISLYSAPQANTDRGLWYGLIRVKSDEWPQKDIVEKMRTLPPSIRILINPERII